MPDPDSQIHEEVTPVSAEENSLADAVSGLVNKEKGWEHNMPVHVLMSELIPTLYDPAVKFVCVKSSESWSEVESEAIEGFTYNDPDFKEFPLENQKTAASYTESQKYILPGQKNLNVFHLNLNSAYLPFNTWQANVVMDQRESEVAREQDFRKQNPSSAFEKPFEKEAFKESVVLNFDGYVYSIFKIARYDGDEKFLVKIEKFVGEYPNSEKKEILPSTEMKSMNSSQFNSLLGVLYSRHKNSSQKES